MVHVRQLGDQTLTFIVSGKLWRNSLIMQDKQTGTLWSHVTGEALDGPLKGKRLRILPSVQTTWSKWFGAHPSTKVLRKEQPVKGSRYEAYEKDPKRYGLFRTRAQMGKLSGKALVQGVVWEGKAAAVADRKLGRRPVRVELGKGSAYLVRVEDGGVKAFLDPVPGRKLTYNDGRLLDKATGQAWDKATGQPAASRQGTTGQPAAEGTGTPLEELPVREAYWFAWISFYPDTALVR